jgi:hypothetical protein
MNEEGQISVATSTPSEATYFCLGLLRAAEKMILESILPSEKPVTKKKPIELHPQLRATFDEIMSRLDRGEGVRG